MHSPWPPPADYCTFTTEFPLPAVSPAGPSIESSCALLASCADYAARPNYGTHGCRGLNQAYDRTLATLALALEMRDKETEGHSRRVVAYALTLARCLGMPAEELATLERGALMHDVGKIGVPDAILWKAGPLTAGEWQVMRNHPDWGRRILAGMPLLGGAAQIVSAHQERWDGGGYPLGLAGEAIPLGARIVAVADTFDTITSNRPYRAAQSYAAARAEIAHCAGTQFDPRVAAAFAQLPEEVWAAT